MCATMCDSPSANCDGQPLCPVRLACASCCAGGGASCGSIAGWHRPSFRWRRALGHRLMVHRFHTMKCCLSGPHIFLRCAFFPVVFLIPVSIWSCCTSANDGCEGQRRRIALKWSTSKVNRAKSCACLLGLFFFVPWRRCPLTIILTQLHRLASSLVMTGRRPDLSWWRRGRDSPWGSPKEKGLGTALPAACVTSLAPEVDCEFWAGKPVVCVPTLRHLGGVFFMATTSGHRSHKFRFETHWNVWGGWSKRESETPIGWW